MAASQKVVLTPVKDVSPTEETPVKVTRARLTPSQKIAKLEADLAAARRSAGEKAQAGIAKLEAERTKLAAKYDKVEHQLSVLDEQITSARQLIDS